MNETAPPSPARQTSSTHPVARLIAAIILLLMFVGVIVVAVYAMPAVGFEASLMWTAVIGGIAWLIRSNVERTRAHENLLAEQKRQQYYEFIEFINRFASSKADAGSTEIKPDEFRRWSLRMGMIGSDNVVKAWNEVRSSVGKSQDPVAILRPWAKLLLEMRRDCGHYGTKLKPSDLLALFVNDFQSHIDELDA